METPLIEEHRAAGARLAEVQGCVLPEQFSDFEKEYRAARESVAIFDTSWHAVLLLTGRDRVKYLHAISSNNIQALADGQGTLALLLNPQGRIQAEIEVYALPEKLLVVSHASLRERTVALLKKYVIGSQVKIEDMTDQMGSFSVEGPETATVVQETFGVALGEMPEMGVREIIDRWRFRAIWFGARISARSARNCLRGAMDWLRCGGKCWRRFARAGASRLEWRRSTL